MQYQLEVLAQVVALAQGKAQVFLEAVTQGWAQAEVRATILVQELGRLQQQVQAVKVSLAEEEALLREQAAQAEALIQAQELEIQLAQEPPQEALEQAVGQAEPQV